MDSGRKPYNLEDRTLLFSKDLIRVLKSLSTTPIIRRLVDQLIRSGTSIGANYREANDQLSKKDALFRLRIARKEGKETSYWIELLMEACPERADDFRPLLVESKELRNILTSIIDQSQ